VADDSLLRSPLHTAAIVVISVIAKIDNTTATRIIDNGELLLFHNSVFGRFCSSQTAGMFSCAINNVCASWSSTISISVELGVVAVVLLLESEQDIFFTSPGALFRKSTA
jgi:hypothetical protein